MKFFGILLLVLAVLLGTGRYFLGVISNHPTINWGEETRQVEITGLEGYWELTSLRGGSLNGRSIDLDIYQGGNNKSINGSLGCNYFFGSLNINPEHQVKKSSEILLSFAKTRKLCSVQALDFENDYVLLLRSVRSYQIDKDQLVFLDETGLEILKYRRYQEGIPEKQISALPEEMMLKDAAREAESSEKTSIFNGASSSFDERIPLFKSH